MVIVWLGDMDCASALPENKLTTSLQARTPSTHVCSDLESPLVPQLLNQAPAGAQQLSLPDVLMAAHFGHTEVILVAVTASVDIQTLWLKKETTRQTLTMPLHSACRGSYFCRPASLRPTCARHRRCFHSSYTKHRREHNNWPSLIS